LPPSQVFTPNWLAPADVKDWLHINGEDVGDDALITRCCAQTEKYVERCRPEFQADGDPVPLYAADAEVYQGAVMYAARKVRRRNSPAGVQAFGDSGVSFVSKFDADIDQALHTGSWTPPGVG
jgi:hypothetical protein